MNNERKGRLVSNERNKTSNCSVYRKLRNQEQKGCLEQDLVTMKEKKKPGLLPLCLYIEFNDILILLASRNDQSDAAH